MAEELSSKISIILDVFNKGKGKLRETAKEARELSTGARSAVPGVNSLNSSLQGLKSNLPAIIAGLGTVTVAVIAAFKSYKAAEEFETAMADVTKVVGGTREEMDGLRKSILEMSRTIPLSAVELAAIAREAGALGIATKDISQFTEIVAKMSTAFDMTAADAGNAIGKIRNIFGMNLQQITEFGDTVNQLGNNTASVEREIVDSMMRIGASTKSFGMTTQETAALSAAFISLGKTPETASTAINFMLSRLQTAEYQGAKFKSGLARMGVAAEDLATDIQNGPNKAIVKFLETLKGMDDTKRSAALVEMFGAEHQAALQTLVTGLDSYKLALDGVADSSSYAGGMQKEFEIRSATTANKLVLMKNAITEIGIGLGTFFLPMIGDAYDAIADFANGISDFMAEHPAFVAALNSIAGGVGQLFADLAASSFGQLFADGLRQMRDGLNELNAMLESGQAAGYFGAWASQWSAWGNDINAAVDLFAQAMGLMKVEGSGTVSFLIDAFRNFPANVRAFIGIITVEVAAEFDKMVIGAKAIKENLKAIFNGESSAEIFAERDRQLAITDKARGETIDAILKERDTAIKSSNTQIEATQKLRAEWEKTKAARDATAKDKSGETKDAPDEKKKLNYDKAVLPDEKEAEEVKPIAEGDDDEPIEGTKEDKLAKREEAKATKEAERLQKQQEREDKAAAKEDERLKKQQEREAAASIVMPKPSLDIDSESDTESQLEKKMQAEEAAAQKAEKAKEERRAKNSGGNQRAAEDEKQIVADRAEAGKKYEEDMQAAQQETLESGKQAAEELADAQTAAAEKSKSAFQQYADRVISLQDEIAGREKSLAQELSDLDGRGTEESKWKKMLKDAKEYEKAGRAALAIGNYGKAKEMADTAKGLYSNLKGGAGKVAEKTANQAAYNGVESAGALGISIAKAQQAESAKSAVASAGAGNIPGALGQAKAAMNGIANQVGQQKVDKVHELRFDGGRVQGQGNDVERLLDVIKRAGMATA